MTPHKLRHTLARRLYGATKSQVLVGHQLGHASTQVTDLQYTHIVNDEQKNALDRFMKIHNYKLCNILVLIKERRFFGILPLFYSFYKNSIQ